MKALGNLSLRRRTLLCLGLSLAVVVAGELALVPLAGGAGLIDVQVSRGLWLLGSGSAAEAAIVAALSASGALLAGTAAYMTGGRPLQAAYRAALDGSREQAHTDDLTGLPNRRSLQVALARTLQGAKESDGAAALLFLDLDGFKDLNDSMGHAAGDLLLQLVGARLRPLLRDGDVLARIGGDEFAVVLPGAGENGALEIVGRVQQGLATAFPVRDVAIHVEASIGVALYPLHGDDAEALVQRADVAMYQAKRARTGFELYSLERDATDQGRLGLLGEMRRAIAAVSFGCTTSPRSTCARATPSGSRRSCAGATPSADCCSPASSCRWPSRPGSCAPSPRGSSTPRWRSVGCGPRPATTCRWR